MPGKTQNKPYRLLARYYDQLQADAPAMTRHARKKILGKMLPEVHLVCDLGCGSGETALDFARDGRKVFAVDLSPTLCRITREKARRKKLPVRVLCADMCSFRLPKPVDLVTCEFSVLNHAPRQTDLGRILRAVWRALRPGGYFLFDLDTPQSLKEQYPGTHWFDTLNFKLVLRAAWDSRRRKARLDFEWFLPSGTLWNHHHECVENVSWTDAEIRRALRQTGFRRIQVFDGVDVRPFHPQAKRGYDRYFLAQKPLKKRKRR